MQTISNMQRDSFYKTYLKYLLLFIGLVFYESITSIYLYLSPLFGVVFFYLLQNIYKKESIPKVVLGFIYIFIYEIDKGFIPLSFFIFFGFYYHFIYDKIEYFFNEKIYKIAVHITGGYIGYYVINVMISYLYNYDIPAINFEYLIYIITDILVLVALF